MKSYVISFVLTLSTVAGATTQKTHACAGNNGGDVSLVDVIVEAETGRKHLKLAESKGPIRNYVITRETAGSPTLLEGWEIDEKTGKSLGTRIAMQVPDSLKTQGDLTVDGKVKKIRCSPTSKPSGPESTHTNRN